MSDKGSKRPLPEKPEPAASPVQNAAPAVAPAGASPPQHVVAPPPAATTTMPPPAAPESPVDDPWIALAEAQAALAEGFERIANEMSGLTRLSLSAASEAAVALLGARTFAEAVEINAGLARRNVDAIVEGSARLSELGVAAMTEASRPILTRFGAALGSAGTLR